MIGTYLTGIGGIVGLMVVWVVVQSFWRKTFSEHINDEDVLAERRSCSNCGCTTVCKTKLRELSTE
ncbi:MAG: hypothetical protein KDD63_28285 [Bacteroidetes bacterium]|nr:hypothetical protein [Bacteroidota bacterium]MCB0856164.1 hypothetical protein [Bacteroidota bacterium]